MLALSIFSPAVQAKFLDEILPLASEMTDEFVSTPGTSGDKEFPQAWVLRVLAIKALVVVASRTTGGIFRAGKTARIDIR